jgi:hypothetical protein
MAPNFQAVGAQQNSTGASVNVAWPTHLTNDIGLVVIETSGNSANLTPPAGWAAIPGTPVTDVATTAGSKLHVWWKRAASSAEAAVATGAATDHIVARLFTFRGCVTTGNPWDVTTTGTKTTASTTATVPALTTTVDDTLITMVVGRPNDNASTTHFGIPVNANLTGLDEAGEAGTTSGNGGGFVVSYGVEPTAGNTGTSTLSKIASTTDTYVVLALQAPLVNELICDTGSFDEAGVALDLNKSSVIHSITGVYAVNGINTIVAKNTFLDVSAGSYSLVGNLLDPNIQRAIVGTTGPFTVAGVNTLLQRAARLDTITRTYDVAGTTTTVAYNRALIGQTGTFTIAGVQVELTYFPSAGATYTLDNQTGSFAVAGIFSDISKQYLLGATPSTFTVAGVQTGLLNNRRINATTSSVVLSGQLVGLNLQFLLGVTKGTFSVTGVTTDFNRQYQLNPQRGVFSFDGINIGQVGQRLLNATTKELTTFSVPLELRRSFPLIGTSGSFSVGSEPLQYFATRTLNVQPATYVLYAQDGGSNLFRYVPLTTPQPQLQYPLKPNQWILGRFSTLGGSYRI